MAGPIAIAIDDARVVSILSRMVAGLDDPQPLLGKIGEDLTETSKHRFVTGTAPDGTPWAPNTEATYLAYLDRKSGRYSKDGQRTGTKRGYEDKDGRIAWRGSASMMGKKPLVGESKSLSTQIYYHVDGQMLFVGSPMIYAPMQQFGGRKADFPNLWGDISARPFLGLSDSDVEAMERRALDYLDYLSRE